MLAARVQPCNKTWQVLTQQEQAEARKHGSSQNPNSPEPSSCGYDCRLATDKWRESPAIDSEQQQRSDKMPK